MAASSTVHSCRMFFLFLVYSESLELVGCMYGAKNLTLICSSLFQDVSDFGVTEAVEKGMGKYCINN